MPELRNEVRHMITVYAVLCIFCTLPMSAAGGERAFSKLKTIEDHYVLGQALQCCHAVH